jgi:Ca2+-binding RTX toxin-like protein
VKFVVLIAVGWVIALVQAGVGAASLAWVGTGEVPGDRILHYEAAAGEANDGVIVDHEDGGFEITDGGATIAVGSGCTSLAPHRVRCNLDDDDTIDVMLGDGNDLVSVDVFSVGVRRVQGGRGDDRIRGSRTEFGLDRLWGGRGDDSLFGREGTDVLDGGPGADDLSGGTSCDTGLDGACFTAIDTVTYAGRTRRVHADADNDTHDDGSGFVAGDSDEGDTIFADVERLVGGSNRDVLGGTTTNLSFAPISAAHEDPVPFLVGMWLEGRKGNDVLRGGRAPDLIIGGRGDDVLRGRLGRDRLRGGRGNDRLFARDGRRDRVNGGPARDEARIDTGLDRVRRVEKIL